MARKRVSGVQSLRQLKHIACIVGSACLLPACAQDTTDKPIADSQRTSGYYYQSEDTRALQDDDFANPGFLWVDQGEQLYTAVARDQPSCANCHNNAERSLVGAAARYPQVDSDTNTLINLEQQINRCRAERQSSPAFAFESPELLSISAYVASLSRGMPFDVDIDGPASVFFENGREYFFTRRGQLNLACHHCHDWNAGRRLRGNVISEGHSNGYPAYRLEWQGVGSLHRRLQLCNTGVRAAVLPGGDPQYLSLELYLAWRAQGLAIETPAVRR